MKPKLKGHKSKGSGFAQNNYNLTYHYRKRKGLTYPINTMRNVGRVPATSHYIFPSDLELYPSPGLIPQFLKLVSEGISY